MLDTMFIGILFFLGGSISIEKIYLSHQIVIYSCSFLFNSIERFIYICLCFTFMDIGQFIQGILINFHTLFKMILSCGKSRISVHLTKVLYKWNSKSTNVSIDVKV